MKLASVAAPDTRQSQLIQVAVLWLVVVASAVSVAFVSHLCRQQYAQLAAAERLGNQLKANYGRFILEQSTWGSLPRVESIASDNLDMQRPVASDMWIVDQQRSGGG
ncbi:MAG: cell division protein FtsL [Porticoccaceae bacterium]|nr:cell division protein FtsL [Porticoccaceae bacterium]